jgi:hypothetical protein
MLSILIIKEKDIFLTKNFKGKPCFLVVISIVFKPIMSTGSRQKNCHGINFKPRLSEKLG